MDVTRHARQRVSRSAGFTLIEVMVVVVILAVLATMVVPRVVDRPDDARIAKAKQDIQSINSALQLYRLDNQVYPSTNQGLAALVEEPSGEPVARNWRAGGYLDRLPEDPWGNEYQYLSPGEHGPFDLYSLGANGQLGGDGVDAVIGNWQTND